MLSSSRLFPHIFRSPRSICINPVQVRNGPWSMRQALNLQAPWLRRTAMLRSGAPAGSWSSRVSKQISKSQRNVVDWKTWVIWIILWNILEIHRAGKHFPKFSLAWHVNKMLLILQEELKHVFYQGISIANAVISYALILLCSHHFSRASIRSQPMGQGFFVSFLFAK